MTTPPGTTRKGGARRDAIVAAAAQLVGRAGPDAVTHRAVATAAGVPLAATTYYFRDLDDLLVSAVTQVGERETATAARLVAALPAGRRSTRDTATVVLDVLLGADRRTDEQLQAYYERWLAGGRHPALRPVLVATRARVDELLTEVLVRGGHREVPVARLVALADGTALSALVEGQGGARAATEDAVAELLSRRRRW
ncbi:TetR/AcrR family transcriptional regulator [Klenkia brasiliensis]|uniref:Transcriptional regulator, TetR family n=1 Tax=Klenkia brasiliensis TaxID=333142 RepID=A0A1G7N956_9ACTN|nr:TetR family transcriptional regulator [Klenkia brasiliensis]SDF70583.1 transcriptional regulator, TetR family [Klenkia brasiliensis]